MRFVAFTLAMFLVATSASAAPMWLERQAVPKAALASPQFEKNDPGSTVVIDHGSWSIFLDQHLVAAEDGINRIRYDAVSDEGRAALDAYIRQLEGVDVSSLAPSEQLAYWINLYNAATVRLARRRIA